MLILKLGYRNLWRNRRRTLLTMSAMALATALLILTLGIYDGMLWDMIEGATDLYHGHVKITAEDYLDQHKLHQNLPSDFMENGIGSLPHVKGMAGRVRGYALLSFQNGDESHSQPAELFGIDPAEEKTVTTLDKHVSEGVFLTDPASDQIVLGKGLAQLLETEIGGEIIAMGQGADGSIAADIFHVVGIINTNDPIRDAMLAVVGRNRLQEMLVVEGRLHEVALSLDSALKAEEWVAEHRDSAGDLVMSPWNEFLPQIGQVLKMWGTLKLIFAIIFYFAVILVSANTMYMALLERMREFGIMGAIGMKIRRLSWLIVLEGFLMSAISGMAGGIVGVIGTYILRDHHIDLSRWITPIAYAETVLVPRIRSYPNPGSMFMPIIVIIILGVIVSLFPARKLKKQRPVDVLREV